MSKIIDDVFNEEEKMITIIEEKSRSLDFGVVGTGQAGSRLAETFYNLGYSAVCFNTALQDLKHIKIPEENKLLLEYGLGGAAKETEIGKEAAETHKQAISDLIELRLGSCQMVVLCLSLGGGSGAGSCETMIDILSSLGKVIIVMTVLPMSNDDAQTKKNALETLSKLAKEAQFKRIHNLIVVDNAKIEAMYSNVSQMDFFDTSNKVIIDPLNAFNVLSSLPSQVKSLDPMELTKILVDGGGLSVYGDLEVYNYDDESSISDSIVQNINSGLLASGFDLKQSKYVGVILAAPKRVWDKIPSSSVNYAMSTLHELCSTPNGIFRGIYTTDSEKDCVKVYFMFSGLGLPDSRVQQLKKETVEYSALVKNKDESRSLNLKLDTGNEEVSAADKVKQKIAAKKSAFGSMLSASLKKK